MSFKSRQLSIMVSRPNDFVRQMNNPKKRNSLIFVPHSSGVFQFQNQGVKEDLLRFIRENENSTLMTIQDEYSTQIDQRPSTEYRESEYRSYNQRQSRKSKTYDPVMQTLLTDKTEDDTTNNLSRLPKKLQQKSGRRSVFAEIPTNMITNDHQLPLELREEKSLASSDTLNLSVLSHHFKTIKCPSTLKVRQTQSSLSRQKYNYSQRKQSSLCSDEENKIKIGQYLKVNEIMDDCKKYQTDTNMVCKPQIRLYQNSVHQKADLWMKFLRTEEEKYVEKASRTMGNVQKVHTYLQEKIRTQVPHDKKANNNRSFISQLGNKKNDIHFNRQMYQALQKKQAMMLLLTRKFSNQQDRDLSKYLKKSDFVGFI